MHGWMEVHVCTHNEWILCAISLSLIQGRYTILTMLVETSHVAPCQLASRHSCGIALLLLENSDI